MNTTPTTWTHKGHEITIDPKNAKFVAVVTGKRLVAPSLDAMKAKIDKAAVFEEFDCYMERTGWDSPTVEQGAVACLPGEFTGKRSLILARVIGKEAPPHGRRSSGQQFRVRFPAKGGTGTNERHEFTVYPATPEALAAWTAYWEFRDSAKKAEHELEQANNARLAILQELLPIRRASEES